MPNVTVHTGDTPGCTLCAHPEPVPILSTPEAQAYIDSVMREFRRWRGDDAGAARVDWLAWLAVLGIVAAMAVGGALTGVAY